MNLMSLHTLKTIGHRVVGYAAVLWALVAISALAPAVLSMGNMANFNEVIMVAVGIALLCWILVGTWMTAKTGEPLGQEWSSLWVPINIVLACLLLVPANAHGLTLLQGLWGA